MNIDKLNEQQKKAVVHEGSPLLIIAGAGTGKTTVVTHRIAYLIEQGRAKPEEILALTFTDKAAGEMVDRVESMIDMAYTDMRVSTFHAFCQWLLNNYGLDIGLPDRFDVLDGQAAWMLVYDNFDRFDLDYYKPRGNPYRFVHALVAHFGRAKDEHISPADYLAHAEEVRLNADNVAAEPRGVQGGEGLRLLEVANAYHVYNQLLLEKGALDFGDLLMYGLQLLQQRPVVLRELQERFKYILVDEFQDTNWIQYELVKTLAGGGNGLSVVADDDQSIYKFRGASVANVMQFLGDYSDAARVTLKDNYRSGQSILDCAYQFIQNNNPERLEAKEGLDKRLVGHVGDGEVVGRYFGTQSQEDAFVVSEIQRLGARGSAVLCRTNAQAQHMVEVLDRAGVPVHFHARSGLFRDPMIVDCVSWLTLLDDPDDNTSCYRVFNNVRKACPASDVAVIVGLAKQKSWSYVRTCRQIGQDGLSDEGKKWVGEFLQLLDAHQSLMQENSAWEMAYVFFEEFGWLQYMSRESDAQMVVVLQSFLDEIEGYQETQNRVFVHDFLLYIRILMDSGYEGGVQESGIEPEGCVQVMTVHASKGLEFDNVFIPQLVHLRFPSVRRRESIVMPDALIKEELPEGDVHLQEERRLMYVACTRAKKRLCLSYALDYGGKRNKKASVFVDELGVEFCADEKQEIASSQAPRNDRLSVVVPYKFSFTSLRQFATCPLAYKFDQIVKIPTRGAGALSFGQSVHSALERFYKKMVEMNSTQQTSLFGESVETSGALKVPSLDDLLGIYEKSFVEDWYASAQQKKEYRKRGRDMMKEFYDANELWVLPKFVEQSVHFSVGDAMIYGAIDRVDEELGEYVIIDYKTGKPKTDDKLTKDDKLQLLIYVIGLEATCGIRASRCEFWYLEDGSKVVFEPTDEDVCVARETVVERISEIQKSDFTPSPSQFNCADCKFRSICEFRG